MRKTQRNVVLSTALVASFALTACTPELPTPEAPSETSSALPALSAEQGVDIFASVGEVLAKADGDKKSAELKTRVTGPALKIRSAEYKIAAAAKDKDKSSAITELPVEMQSMFVTTSEAWPRTVFAVSQRPQNLEPERFMVYTQDSAHDPYQLWAWFALFPGTTVPKFPALEAGTTEVNDLDETLKLKPEEVLKQYSELLKDASKANKSKFDVSKDAFYKEIDERRTYLEDAAKQIKGTYKEEFTVGKDWRALRTSDGGAVVVGTVETTGTLKGEKGAIVSPSAIEKAFLDKDKKSSNALTVKRSAVVGIYVPAKDSEEKPRAIGRVLRTTGASIP
jgi:hypothetical protein